MSDPLPAVRPFDKYFGGFGRALSNSNYRTYWTGQVLHVQGWWLYRIAAGWLMFDLTHSPAWLGAVGFALAAPFLILSPIAGAICDRAGHRRTAIIAILFGFPIMAATAALTWSGAMTPKLLFALVIVQSIFTAFESPARQSLVPVLIGRRYLTEGMSLNWATFNAAFITGPMIAGFLLVAGGAALTFTAATSTFIWMLIMLLRIRGEGDAPRGRFYLHGLMPDVISGITYTLRHPLIPWVIGFHMILGLLIRPYIELMPGVASVVFEAGEQGMANLLATSGAGALVVSVVMLMAGRERWLMPILVWTQLISALSLAAFAATDVLWIALVAVFFAGGFTTAAGIAASTLVQQSIDAAFRGRVVAISLATNMGGPALGAFGIGWLAEGIGFQGALMAAAALSTALMIITGRRVYRARSVAQE
ncbi:MAG: MFS transporter [Rhodospirillaceae bacterium]|jgi:MFS family permease|nr:MFS transporter [Rhodospirillaceae bacterium]MBT3887433.1 MFS transporter [Rhodospirillaceae bacterium]MBT4119264.1 MFS transporter [Rhodospirillaceae bacterium]MBT4670764.1 MFS transporter [Rhodospirillaceae bacterium]MBT4721897.1 MFS transporter [Rhodospirillaceae bacterium]